MSSADIGLFGEELYEQVLPMHGPDPDGLARDLIGAYVHGALFIDKLARDTDKGPGWGVILDVDDCPIVGLLWLAQIAGVTLRDPRTITRYNVISNSSGEFSYLGGYFTFHCNVSRVLGGTVGDYMIRSTVTSNASAALIFTSAFGPDANIAVGVDVIAVARALHLEIEFQDGGFGTLESVTSAASTTTGRRSLTAKSPAGTEFVSFRVWMPSALMGEKFDLDAFSMVIGTTEDEYFDGSSPGGSYNFPANPELSGSFLTRLETPEEWAAYARDAIKRQGGKNRGKPDAILSVAEDHLTGTKNARLIERVGGDAYQLELVTRPSETPDPDALLADLIGVAPDWNGKIPAGMKLTHTLTEGVTIDEGTRTIDTASGTIDTATLSDVT